MKRLKWLYPGMRIKRWVALSAFGAMLFGAGVILILTTDISNFLTAIYFSRMYPSGQPKTLIVGVPIVIAGFLAMIYGFKNTMGSVIHTLMPEDGEHVAEVIYKIRHLSRGPKIVVVGGGTGLSVLLKGLKKYTSNITAIVTVSDDGGSSGVLRGKFGVLPPGDIRNCLVALADKETLMEKLFQHRFTEGEGLAGHTMGNLLITAMSQISGDFQTAIRQMSKVLAIRGQVLPATLQHCVLCAEMDDGSTVEGESSIPEAGKKIKQVFLKPGKCLPVAEAITALEDADLIVLGPGSLYTSVIPNLLVEGMTDFVKSSFAPKVYVCNIMTQPGETQGMTASDHLAAIINHTRADLIDYAIINNGKIPAKLLGKYKDDGAVPVKADIDKIRTMNIKVVQEDLVYETDVVRHEPEKLANAIIRLAAKVK